MKSDREFLDGIYDKAKQIEMEIEPRKIMYPKFRFRPAIAIVFTLIVSPLIIYSSFNKSTQIPKGYTNNIPIVRSVNIEPEFDLDTLIEQSNFIIQGKIVKILKSVYGEDGLLYTKIKVTKSK